MGFRTLAVQKRSSEVWNVLGAVKSEFAKFSEHLGRVQKQLNTASGTLETLRVTRTKQIERKLKSVESLDGLESGKILEIAPDDDEDEPKA
jgi:DNA recombination protein RmuC